MAPRRLSLGKKLLFALVPTLVLLVLLAAGGELGLRLAYDRVEQITGAVRWRGAGRSDERDGWDRYHPTRGWTNVPGFTGGADLPFRVTINEQGLRAFEPTPKAPPTNAVRLAVFGDSCTFGEEVDDDQNLPHHLQRHLRPAEVLNFGVHGYGLGQMILRLEEEGFAFSPERVVLIITLPSDIFRAPEPHFFRNKPAFVLEGERLRVANVPVPRASRQPAWARHSYLLAWLFARAEPLPRADTLERVLDTSRALLKRLRAACGKRDVGLTVVDIIAPTWIDSRSDEPLVDRILEGMRRVQAEVGIDAIDAVPFLIDLHERGGDQLVMPQGHWSGAANCHLAAQLAGALVEREPGLRLDPDATCPRIGLVD